ncbi:MAG: PspC domain-containing protein [Chloroflexi bacterium]|nr:PspC domain-containing protein [Chloroflexota bacterium]
MNRRLYRCRHDQRIAVVASGVAEYFDADPTLVRILWVLSIFVGGFGLLLYIAMALIVPLEPEQGFIGTGSQADAPTDEAGVPGEAGIPGPTGWQQPPSGHLHASHRGEGRGALFVGLALVLFGTLALVDAYLPAWADHGRFLWPAFILGIGAILVASAVRREPTKP